MTAEVVVLNRTAVALAADSAVTVTNRNGRKSKNSADKLFQLSETEPVGILVFNNADFMGYPVETIIKNFRRSDKSDPKDTLQEYADAFFAYLEEKENIKFDDELYLQHLLNFISSDLNDWLSNAFYTAYGDCAKDKNFEMLDEIFKQIIFNRLDSEETFLNSMTSNLKFDDFNLGETSKIIYDVLEKNIINLLVTMPHTFTDEFINNFVHNLLTKSIWILHLRLIKNINSNITTGFAFCGFGRTDDFPSAVVFETDGIIDEKVKFWAIDNELASKKVIGGRIIPLAQTDVADRYIEGIDPYLTRKLQLKLPELFEDFSKVLLNDLGFPELTTNQLETVKSRSNNLVLFFFNQYIDNYKNEQREEIFSSVGVMSKSELAQFAEALVEMTALRKRISMELESVGGPVDVAVISKGDGFIWIKRKHYFEAELNPRYSALKKTVIDYKSEQRRSSQDEQS